jgi:hypothetical protein
MVRAATIAPRPIGSLRHAVRVPQPAAGPAYGDLGPPACVTLSMPTLTPGQPELWLVLVGVLPRWRDCGGRLPRGMEGRFPAGDPGRRRQGGVTVAWTDSPPTWEWQMTSSAVELTPDDREGAGCGAALLARL